MTEQRVRRTPRWEGIRFASHQFVSSSVVFFFDTGGRRRKLEIYDGASGRIIISCDGDDDDDDVVGFARATTGEQHVSDALQDGGVHASADDLPTCASVVLSSAQPLAIAPCAWAVGKAHAVMLTTAGYAQNIDAEAVRRRRRRSRRLRTPVTCSRCNMAAITQTEVSFRRCEAVSVVGHFFT